MREYIEPLAQELEQWANEPGPGKNGLFRPLLRVCDPSVAMYLALHALFDHFLGDASLSSLAIKIGGMVEDDLRFTAFREKNKNYYEELQRSLKMRGVKSYAHKHRVFTFKANEAEDEWQKWSPSERAGVGMKLLDIILEHTDLIEKVHLTGSGKSNRRRYNDVRVVPTEAARAWMDEHHAMRELLYPDRMPCVIEPDPWTDIDQGGYYSAELRNTTKLIKTHNGPHRKFIRRRWNRTGRAWLSALNSVQKTPWSVNTRVLVVLKEAWMHNLALGIPAKEPLVPPPCPVADIAKEDMTEADHSVLTEWKQLASTVYTQEKERVAKAFQVSRIIRLANEFSDMDRFWYVWTFDFRGRMYAATSSFSPQGPDVAKGLLQFAEGKPLGARGLYWLKVNIANRFGYDKEDYDGRVRWVDERHDLWLHIADDPINAREHWRDADKPYQMLAAILEYADAMRSGNPEEFISHIPVGLDGSCNGLQNFSAMLRDEVGGRATNLVPQSKPADIYALVGAVCGKKIRRAVANPSTDPEDANHVRIMATWGQFLDRYGNGDALPRSLPKRPVMTLPYGATRQSCTQYIYAGILKIDGAYGRDKNGVKSGVFEDARFQAATALTPLMWDSIGEVVIAARHAMTWLQKCAGVVGKQNSAIFWDTPDGFPVWQAEYQTEDIRVRTQLAGDFRIRLRPYTDDICSRTMRQSISPNFVHSMDANHLRETVRRCIDAGITDLAVIHDDYGTHACNTDALHKIIREAFVHQYTEYDPLGDFRAFQETLGYELPDLPARGKLDIRGVLDSPYFFG
ncbi:putative DNA-dependent RNA polymerase protein [Stappia phage SI01]|uniref:DNA-directed RNA polymerase n=1 Tax=Stappia phage SI01 TaxID=2847766 RepID=A0AAE7SPW0_9CAUD|nr:putative DNA-dependent RNA polymerase protein [Stappia phage SI01]